jgi:hypothetical protein
MTIDAFASKPWYVDHLAPIWRALGADAGRFHVRGSLTVAAAAGLAGVTEERPAGPDPIVTVATSDYLAAFRAGRRQIALGQHGAGQSYGTRHPSYPGGDDQDGVGLFLVPNATAAGVTLERYPASRVAIVGCPKVDRLPCRIPDGRTGVVAISTHWNARIVPEAGSAWPAFGRALLELATTHHVIGHAHPRMAGRIGPFYRAAGIEVADNFMRVLERADVLVMDNSSSIFEFAATGRPVVVLNPPQYRRAISHGLRFWEAAGVGVNVDAARDLEPAITRALELRPVDVAAREAALDIVYQPRQGSAELAAAALRAWAG